MKIKLLLLIVVFNITILFANSQKSIKVSYDPDYAPYTYSVDGKPYGLFVDIYKKWAKVNNYKLEFKNGKTWESAIALAKDGKVDFFIGTDPYEDWMKASKPYYEVKTALFSLNSQTESFKKIGIIGEDLKDDILKEFPDIDVISYETYEELINSLLEKKVDAIYDDSIALDYFILKHNKSHIIKQLNIISNSSVISAISNNQQKVDIFTKGFEKIDKNDLAILEDNWIFNTEQKYFNKHKKLEDIFSDDEKKWMKKNRVVKFAVMSYWPHDENGESFHTAMLKLINKYLGTNFIPVKYNSWSDGFSMASSGEEVHGIMGLSYSKSREQKYFYYTPAYNFSPSYIVVKDTNNNIKDLKDLENKTIYLKTKSISHKIVSSNLKHTKVIDLSTIDDMYKNLSTATKVDAFISYFVDKELLKKYNLKIAKTMYEKYGETSIGVSHNYPLLASIIKKAYTIIPKQEIVKLRDKKWEKKTLLQQINWKLIIEISAVILLIILFILWNNRKLKIMVEAKTKELQELADSLEEKIEERTQDLDIAKKEIEATHKHTRESIEYAALIQSSLVPDNHLFRKYFQEYFVIWHPKDTVGGDIYLFNEIRDDECLIFCVDCTGHGVPGAFVTMIVKAVEAQLMAEIYNNPDMQISTSWIMTYYNNTLKKMLKQDQPDCVSNVGWDGSVLYYNKKEKLIKFSGAESPFFYRKPNGEIVTVKGTRKSVGYKQSPMDYKYKETIIENVEVGTKIFLTTDGYLDQNGGPKDFPFGKKKFIQIIDDYGEESMSDLQEMFLYVMAEWEEQIEHNDRNDDMTVIGFTI